MGSDMKTQICPGTVVRRDAAQAPATAGGWSAARFVQNASLIVLFGMASSGLLAILFIFITLHRRTSRLRRFMWRRYSKLRGKRGKGANA